MKATKGIIAVYHELITVEHELEVLKRKKRSLEDRIKYFMGDDETLTVEKDNNIELMVTWKHEARSQFQVAKFRDAYPDLAKQFTALVECRRLLKKGFVTPAFVEREKHGVVSQMINFWSKAIGK